MSATATQTEIKERPILFSGPMVKAILEGRKTQTRRVVRPQPWDSACGGSGMRPIWGQGRPRSLGGNVYAIHARFGSDDKWLPSPYGGPGERLWVRETWNTWGTLDHIRPAELPRDTGIAYAADMKEPRAEACGKLRPSIFMPRWASRITLEITDVRVERLRDITLDDIRAEGMPRPESGLHANEYWREEMGLAFVNGWNHLNAARGFGWETNPWVWALTFRKA